MNWDDLLKEERFGVPEQKPNRYRGEAEEDYDNIVFSTAFRRLQGKTQVFGLSGSDYVRTRLTHSFEVASVGRCLGTMVENECKPDNWKHPSKWGTTVAAACLAHDIGNPPFGHSGESAIRQWFKESKIVRELDLQDSQKLDLENWEGNAQAFRVLTKLQGQGTGLKLTYATLAAMTKYPFRSEPGVSKFGFFESESLNFADVAARTGLIQDERTKSRWCRHPFAYLVEAADDICNRIVDFEDSARLRILTYGDVLKHFQKLRDALGVPNDEIVTDEKAQVEILSRKLLRKLVEQIALRFIFHRERILDGTMENKPLIETIEEGAANELREIKKTLENRVFTARPVVEIEAPAFQVLHTLIETFVAANEELCKRGEQESSKKSRLLINLVPTEFRSHLTSPTDRSAYMRVQDILDFVSGMTDVYAVSLYKTITGISLSVG